MSGQAFIPFSLQNIQGKNFSTDQLTGKRFMITFFRFAGCPFCNLRVQQLVQQWEKFNHNFTIIGIFDASVENLQKNLSKHDVPFVLLADKTNQVYRQYGVERSLGGVVKGLITHFPQLIYSVLIKRNFMTNIGGSMLTMPASFLVEENGNIHTAYYGKDEFDHISVEQVLTFANIK
jgi:thioredoxin-dependent peroxiredoxin